MEAMPQGGALTIRGRATTSTVDVEVHDTGVGFADEAPIFDAFFTTKPQGTGLGLTIVHRIVALHGGAVRVRSRPGDTSFTVSLPLASPGP
jgi:signal transduction histidine kinase